MENDGAGWGGRHRIRAGHDLHKVLPSGLIAAGTHRLAVAKGQVVLDVLGASGDIEPRVQGGGMQSVGADALLRRQPGPGTFLQLGMASALRHGQAWPQAHQCHRCPPSPLNNQSGLRFKSIFALGCWWAQHLQVSGGGC